MADDLNDFLALRGPAADRPLLGLTVLVVEDSRFASEAMRLLCLRSGARIRRADCLRSARRHLQTYRPAVAIIDMGLPDGSGADLLAELADLAPRLPALLGTSADPDMAGPALAAGAGGFLQKPVESLALFQQTVLGALSEPTIRAARGIAEDRVAPDRMALRDDLAHAAEMLRGAPDERTIEYVARFLSGVALGAHDPDLGAAAQNLARRLPPGLPHLAGLIRDRLAAGSPI
ncbi:MAG: response regulator [Proteobacteria bacterium]|nr:response regulator [Pseudomonadota bacterium]MBS0572742.1 response regulator [Pseudomonadota bacterium]